MSPVTALQLVDGAESQVPHHKDDAENCTGSGQALHRKCAQGGPEVVLTAGSAKKEMPRMAQKAAMSFPGHVMGTVSPYPTVHSVI